MRQLGGFTLIELMISMSIVGILSAIAFTQYQSYAIRSTENACLAEAVAYTKAASLALLQIPPVPADIPVQPTSACTSFSGVAVDMNSTYTATPNTPGVRLVSCRVSTASCALI